MNYAYISLQLVYISMAILSAAISDFLPFSPNLVANHTPISSITPHRYLESPRPWQPQ